MKAHTFGIVWFLGLATATLADTPQVLVPMANPGTDTYYVQGDIEGFGPTDMIVDTGSSYSAISEETLAALLASGNARYVKKLQGIMADGSRRVVAIYTLSHIILGGACVVRDVEAAVFPGNTRPILGMSALRKVSPFTISLDPPNLHLSRCDTAPVQATPDDEASPALQAAAPHASLATDAEHIEAKPSKPAEI